MRVGAVFPQTEIPPDPGAVREFAVGAAELGCRHLHAYDHVVGADPASHPGWSGPYDVEHRFFEPLVLFGFLAEAVELELVTGILILPQRQTALVAKQASAVDVLSGGRLRLGVGIGWNELEYRALGVPYRQRGRRLDEQVRLLREFWTERSVQGAVDGECADGVGLAPLPVQRPIPVWFGGAAEPALERIGRSGDGWLAPLSGPTLDVERSVATIARAAAGAGRDPGAIGIDARLRVGDGELGQQAAEWARFGATHLTIETMGAGHETVAAHLRALADAVDAVGAA